MLALHNATPQNSAMDLSTVMRAFRLRMMIFIGSRNIGQTGGK